MINICITAITLQGVREGELEIELCYMQRIVRLVINITNKHNKEAQINVTNGTGLEKTFCVLLSFFRIYALIKHLGLKHRSMSYLWSYIFNQNEVWLAVRYVTVLCWLLVTLQTIFRRKLSKLDFDLHFCIMTSVWDFSNPPFYWIIS